MLDGLNRAFSETASLKAEKEMMGAFQEVFLFHAADS